VGCDGAHSAVRKYTELPFEGGAYEQVFVLALTSVALQVLIVTPAGKKDPLGRPLVSVTVWMPQLSAADGVEYDAAVAHFPGSLFRVMFAGQVIVGRVASETLTVKEQVFVLRFGSVAR